MAKYNLIFLVCALACGANLSAKDEPLRIKGRTTELRNKGVLAVYTDGVEVIKGKSTLNARRAAANEETSQVLAEGDVHGRYFAENGDIVEFEASSARYDKNKKTGFLYGGIKATIVPAENPENVYYLESDEIIVYEDKGVVEALKNVYLSGREMDVWAQKALYDSGKNSIILSGSRPMIVSMDENAVNAHRSDNIEISTDKENVVFRGSVKSSVWSIKDAGSK